MARIGSQGIVDDGSAGLSVDGGISTGGGLTSNSPIFVGNSTSTPTTPVGGNTIYASASALRCVDGSGNANQLTVVDKVLNANFTTTAASTECAVTNLSVVVAAGETWNLEFNTKAQIGNSAGFKYQLLTPSGSWVEGELFTNPLHATLSTLLQAASSSNIIANSLNGGSNWTSPTLHPNDTLNTEGSQILVTVAVGPNSGNIALAAGAVTAGQTVTVLTGSAMWAVRGDRV